MRAQKHKTIKQRFINLSQTTQLTNSNQSSSKQSLARYYRRPSLPNTIGQHFINIRNSYEQIQTDIYFNPSKKSKFIKQIVDNYFQQTLQKIYGNQKQSNNRQIKNLQRNIVGANKRNKIFFNSSLDNPAPNNKKQLNKAPKLQNKQIEEQQQGQLFQSINSTSNTTSSFLPPIFESNQDADTIGNIFPEMSQTTQQFPIKADNTSKNLTYENEAFKIYILSQGGQPKYRVKQFKKTGMQILKRQQRVLKFGIERIWKQSNINAHSFISEMVHPLKNLICKLIPLQQGNVKFKVRSSNYRKYLLSNNCLQLKIFIRDICAILKKIEGRVLNNKINPSNIFILKGNKVCIGEWGYSSFRDEYHIQDSKFQSRINPILKSSKQWLTTPEYMSPELLQAVQAKSDQQQPDIWQNKSSSDIWSLGITLFQILTMVPIWMNDQCSLKTKSKKPVIRSGLLGTDDRKLIKIAEKQKKIQKSIVNCLQNQFQQGTDKKIVNLITKMVVYDPSQRITIDGILDIIK